jgi:hypothetical protein
LKEIEATMKHTTSAHTYRLGLVFSLCLAGCGGSSSSPDGVLIEGLDGVKLLGTATLSSDPMPSPTSTGKEPVIASATFENSGSNSFNLQVTFSGSTEVKLLHVQINGKHYVSDLSAGTKSAKPDACEIIAKQQGVTCTPACLKACACVSCSDSTIEDAIEGSCAAVCSINVQQGIIGPGMEPYTSETVFADLEYNGYMEVPGLLQSFNGCSASVCTKAASAAKKATLQFTAPDFSFVPNLQVGNLVATADSPSGPVASQPFNSAAATVSNICPANTNCDGPVRP